MLAAARRAVAPIERSASAAISTSASAGAAAGIPTGHPGPDAHPWLDYKHPGQPGARNDYRDADKDFGFHMSGAFFERPHLRRYSDFLQGDGKLFVADDKTLPKEQVVSAFHVPNAAAFSMQDDSEVDVNKIVQATGQVSLVTVSFSGLGLPTQDTSLWQQKFQSALGSSPAHRQVNLKYMDGFEYFFAPSVFTGMVKSATDKALVPHSYVVYEPYHYNITWFTELAAIHNRAFGFAYLMDKEGNVVWRAHGKPEASELDAMVKVAKSLA